MKLDRRLGLFVTLVGVSLTCLLVGNLTGGKVTTIHLLGRDWPFSVGQLAFPLTFVLTDIFNEFYGRRTARQVTYLMAAMVGFTLLLVSAAGAMPFAPPPPDWKGVTPDAFTRVFTSATRIQLASMVAFLLASLLDITVFFVIKKATGGRLLWLRATGSTVVSQGVDTVVITWLAFAGLMPGAAIWNMILTGYLIKLVWAVAMTPVIYGVHEVLERVFKIEPVRAEHDQADVGAMAGPPTL
ncbi:MAG: queuosine precursor transporter [Kofleriaceae bacterium]|jgi:uncharacterized integral membrane protein (TIGR00697 family)|nr:queuosine precursor transporter [Kofleriaceae bacterium]MBP6836659.1 queuosine precursor transporter [Kofleriaceae bacterium]MBP9205911.1 queuosine precursor transporter [Kofleriaceae bacterium]